VPAAPDDARPGFSSADLSDPYRALNASGQNLSYGFAAPPGLPYRWDRAPGRDFLLLRMEPPGARARGGSLFNDAIDVQLSTGFAALIVLNPADLLRLDGWWHKSPRRDPTGRPSRVRAAVGRPWTGGGRPPPACPA